MAGLSSAIRLASRGGRVTVYDQQVTYGGKMGVWDQDGYRYDTGPSLFTMPQYVNELLSIDGKSDVDFKYMELQSICNYFWEDGTRMKATKDIEQLKEEFLKQLGEPNENIEDFLTDSKTKFETIDNRRYAWIKGRNSPARLIVRDAHLTGDSIKQLRKIDTGLYMTEWKFENGIDRITSAANPRQIERVPAGSKFAFELIYTVEDSQQMEEDLQNIAIALAILEDDALGGHGSRGYGQISFHNFNFYYRSMAQYREIAQGKASFDAIQQAENTPKLLETFGSLNEELRKLLPDGGDS